MNDKKRDREIYVNERFYLMKEFCIYFLEDLMSFGMQILLQ